MTEKGSSIKKDLISSEWFFLNVFKSQSQFRTNLDF